MRLIFMGMGGPLSSAPLAVLLQAGFNFSAVIMAAPRHGVGWRALPAPRSALHSTPAMSPDRSILQLGWAHEIPVYETGDLKAGEALAALQRLAPDVVLVSCFAYRVPPPLLHLPPHGFLNLHPSYLPAYRGPYPIFWQLRDGLRELGLTVQRMDEGLDSGPIARQTRVALRDGMSAAEIERQMGAEGGRLFVHTLQALSAGHLALQPQQGSGSYQSRPRPDDFELDRQWSAQRAFNFMRGTADWGQPYALRHGGARWLLRRALAYDPRGVQQAPIVQTTGGRLRIQFSPGVLEALSL